MSLWICANENTNSTHFYYFEKSFEAQEGASLSAQICADTRYQLYINGNMVCEGPCQGSAYVRYYETADLTPYLVAGENKISVKVMHMEEHSFISVYKESKAALWFHGTLTEDDNTSFIDTDGTWLCFRDDSVKFHNMRGIHLSVPPCEDVLGDTVLVPVSVEEMYRPNIENNGYTRYGSRDVYPLAPRPIPQMKEEPHKDMRVIRKGAGFIEFDAGEYTTAKIALDFCAPKDTAVRVLYSECYKLRDDEGRSYKDSRDAFDDPTAYMDGIYDTIRATGKPQSFKPFWYRAFRFVRIDYPADSEIDIRSFTYGSYFYPLDRAGSFECSNENYNKMWEISRNTVLCCMHEMYVDCPYYEQQQYDMDSALEMLFTFRLGSDTKMPFKSITDLAHSQMQNGMLQANYPSTGVQIIPNFTFFWILMLRDYLRYTGDTDNVRTMLGTVDKALEGFEVLINEDGLIAPTPYWSFVDWVPKWTIGVPDGGREEPLTVTCLMFAASLKAASEICTAIGRSDRAAEYLRRADEMISNVKKHCYDESVGLFKNTPFRNDYSQHTTLWAILSGAVSGEEAGRLIDRTFDTNSGLDISVCTFAMNHYMFRALELSDRYMYAPRLFEGWHTMMDKHCTTWCENPGQPRSECHGWSSAPTYEFSAMILGVYPTADAYRSVRIKPYIDVLDMTWAKGTVPTPFGTIAVQWEKVDGKFSMTVSLPDEKAAEEMDVTVILPDGKELKMDSGTLTAECKL